MWLMTQYADVPDRVFDTLEEGVEWIRENRPSALKARFQSHAEDHHQWDTDNRWIALTRSTS